MRVATISVTGANMIAMSADLVGQLVVFARLWLRKMNSVVPSIFSLVFSLKLKFWSDTQYC